MALHSKRPDYQPGRMPNTAMNSTHTKVALTCIGLGLGVLLAGCSSPAPAVTAKPAALRPDPTGKMTPTKRAGGVINVDPIPAPPGVYIGLKGGGANRKD